MLRRALCAAFAAAFVASFVSPASAGQVRIGVGGVLNAFSPVTVNANLGDHIVWVWQGGMHNVNSGTDGSTSGDGRFRSSTNGVSGLRYTWKADVSGSVPYYCTPHYPDMAGTLNISAAGANNVADLRITEVEFAGAGGHDRVQVSNLGTDLGYLGQYRVTSVTGASTVITADPVPIAAGGSVTLHLNFAGTNNATNVYLATAPELGLPGSIAIFVPNTTTAGQGSLDPGSLTDANQMVDFVEWGTAGQAAEDHRSVAVAAGLWPAGDVMDVTDLPSGGAGYSISFCGTRTQRGSAFWGKTTPNFGTGLRCSTPTRNASWGRIKTLYR